LRQAQNLQNSLFIGGGKMSLWENICRSSAKKSRRLQLEPAAFLTILSLYALPRFFSSWSVMTPSRITAPTTASFSEVAQRI